MKFRILAIPVILAIASLNTPVKAQESSISPQPLSSTTAQVTTEQLANACRQNQAEKLPVPFSDVSPNQWAFKAVMTMYYCGAFRSAAPSSLFERSQPTQSQQQYQAESNHNLLPPESSQGR